MLALKSKSADTIMHFLDLEFAVNRVTTVSVIDRF